MFACLYSLSAPVATLITIAEDFTPRFEVVGPLVMLDVSGLSRLFGSPRDIGEQLRRACAERPIRIGMAPTQTAAACVALGCAGLTVVMPGEEAQVLAMLPVTLLADFDRLRLAPLSPQSARRPPHAALEGKPPSVGGMMDALPSFHSMLDRASDAARAAHGGGGGWKHPRDSHAANECKVRGATCGVQVPGAESGVHSALTSHSALTPHSALSTNSALRTKHSALADIQSLLDTLRRWGVKTFGALAALPVGDVYERLGARGVVWQRRARGEDMSPLVPWVPEDPFEATLDLEWPIEGLEPLSFVLGRLLEPLAERLERADRGAAVLHTHLRLVSKAVHARTLQLPAPMRDPKTLRTLMLLDLESNPPSAAIDRVCVLVEPTPARVTQWMLFARAQPSPEQVSTLLARLMALMGDSHVGSPRLLDAWKPGVFAMEPFVTQENRHEGHEGHENKNCLRDLRVLRGDSSTTATALRRYRLPVPARVQVHEGRPVRVMTDRRGISGGAVVQAAGPWRTSGEWWTDGQVGQGRQGRRGRQGEQGGNGKECSSPPAYPAHPAQNWDRDEWDVAIADGTVYRVFVERDVGQWFIEGVVD